MKMRVVELSGDRYAKVTDVQALVAMAIAKNDSAEGVVKDILDNLAAAQEMHLPLRLQLNG